MEEECSDLCRSEVVIRITTPNPLLDQGGEEILKRGTFSYLMGKLFFLD